jgi:hypothetical protein
LQRLNAAMVNFLPTIKQNTEGIHFLFLRKKSTFFTCYFHKFSIFAAVFEKSITESFFCRKIV